MSQPLPSAQWRAIGLLSGRRRPDLGFHEQGCGFWTIAACDIDRLANATKCLKDIGHLVAASKYRLAAMRLNHPASPPDGFINRVEPGHL
jgi:hypothetical protein